MNSNPYLNNDLAFLLIEKELLFLTGKKNFLPFFSFVSNCHYHRI